MVPNIEHPLILSDFLTSCLDHERNLQIQILGLRTIFVLLEKHGLDYPHYYKRLYNLLIPKFVPSQNQIVSVFTLSIPEEKQRFLRLLDLSLRSTKLPSKLIAAFMKRLGRLLVSHGVCFGQSDQMYVISLIANLIKRHPRVVRLIHRRRKIFKENPTFESDPYNAKEEDPLKSKAMKSSMWELDLVMKDEFDEQVRNYTKLLKGDLSRKTNFFKCEEFQQIDQLDEIERELQSISLDKEALSVKKNLLIKHNHVTFDKQGKIKKVRDLDD